MIDPELLKGLEKMAETVKPKLTEIGGHTHVIKDTGGWDHDTVTESADEIHKLAMEAYVSLDACVRVAQRQVEVMLAELEAQQGPSITDSSYNCSHGAVEVLNDREYKCFDCGAVMNR